MMKIAVLTAAVIGLSLSASATAGFAKGGGHSSSNNSTGANSTAAKAKWNRVQQNIDKHNTGIAQQTKSVSTKSIMKTKHDTVKNSIGNIR
jgi:hypothetical protein